MEWTEVKIYTTRDGIEPVCAVLLNSGINGIQIEDDEELAEHLEENSTYWDYVEEELLNKPKEETKIKVYLSSNPYGRELFLNIKSGISRLKELAKDFDFSVGRLAIETTENLDEDVWLNKWKEFYKPLPIGKKILVKPVWEEILNPNGRIIFNINPGHVFGTGLHQTTQLCIEQLEKHVEKTSSVLDLGCGSGILSIVSLLLGAREVFALDIDQNAVKTAYENAKLNSINENSLYVTCGNIIDDEDLQNKIQQDKYDIVVANIVADVICSIAALVAKKIKTNGLFITSGIIKDRVQDVQATLVQNGFEILDIFFKDEWVCIVARQNS